MPEKLTRLAGGNRGLMDLTHGLCCPRLPAPLSLLRTPAPSPLGEGQRLGK